jgi:hypothetical protein
MWDLWWIKWRWGRFSPCTSISLANLHSTNCYTITIICHLGLVQKANSGRSAEWTQSHLTKNNIFCLYSFLLYRSLTVSRFFIFLWIYTQSVGLLGREIGPSHIYRTRQTQKNAHTPHSVRASEDSSCLRPLGYHDRPKNNKRIKIIKNGHFR